LSKLITKLLQLSILSTNANIFITNVSIEKIDSIVNQNNQFSKLQRF